MERAYLVCRCIKNLKIEINIGLVPLAIPNHVSLIAAPVFLFMMLIIR